MDGVQDGIENAINAYCLRKLRDRAKRCVKVPHLKDGLGPRPVCRFHPPKLCNFQSALTLAGGSPAKAGPLAGDNEGRWREFEEGTPVHRGATLHSSPPRLEPGLF